MAALLHLRPVPGDKLAAGIVARRDRSVQVTPNGRRAARPTLVGSWTVAAGGRLCRHWDIDVPLASVIPPD